MGSWNIWSPVSSTLLSDCIPEETKNRSKYEGMLKDIDGWLSELTDLDSLLSNTKSEYEQLEMNPESGEGWLKDYYYQKEDRNRQDVEQLLNDMIAAREEIAEHRRWLQEQYDYWFQQEQEVIARMQQEQMEGMKENNEYNNG